MENSEHRIQNVAQTLVSAASTLVSTIFLTAALVLTAPVFSLWAQGRGGPAGPQPPARQAAPFDPTGYWVSIIVDEWRFRVTPQKGDLPYLPINADARRTAMAWDPDKDFADGKQCKAYGAVGVMQRPGRLQILWQDDNTLKMEFDAGTQTRILHFGAGASGQNQGPSGPPSWQGDSVAQWQTVPRGRGTMQTPASLPGANGGGTLKITTTNMLPGYIRKNGVPYSEKAVLTEFVNRVKGAENDDYLVVTAEVEDPAFLNQPFVRSYQFKKQADAKGWNPTPCLPR